LIVSRIKHLVIEKRLVEGRTRVRIRRQESAPDPFSRIRKHIRRIARAGLQDGEYGSLRICEDDLPPAPGVISRLTQLLGPKVNRDTPGFLDIPDREESEPRRLLPLAWRLIPLHQSGDRLTLQQDQRVILRSSLRIAEGPAEEPSIECFRRLHVRRDQICPHDLALVVLVAWRVDERRQLEARGLHRCHVQRHCEQSGEQQP
jgi:hypothetical protein